MSTERLDNTEAEFANWHPSDAKVSSSAESEKSGSEAFLEKIRELDQQTSENLEAAASGPGDFAGMLLTLPPVKKVLDSETARKIINSEALRNVADSNPLTSELFKLFESYGYGRGQGLDRKGLIKMRAKASVKVLAHILTEGGDVVFEKLGKQLPQMLEKVGTDLVKDNLPDLAKQFGSFEDIFEKHPEISDQLLKLFKKTVEAEGDAQKIEAEAA